jgi:23S rRNA G2445 N2-methylase RlmL
MKALALTFSGLSDVLAAEIKGLIGVSGKQLLEGVLFEAAIEDIFTVCYRSQSASRVLLLVSEGLFETLSIPKDLLTGTVSFTGKSTSKAQELAELIEAKKVYKNADIPLYLHFENDKHWLGIDLTGDLSKRDYRIFIGSETLSGISAFGALALSGYEPKHVLIDPFCRAGSIVIEAALAASHIAPKHYSKHDLLFAKLATNAAFAERFGTVNLERFFAAQDKHNEIFPGKILALSSQFPSVQATRKNAQIAGVLKAIDFSRTEVDWLDLKFDKQSIDRIVTQPVERRKDTPQKKFAKQATLFFERAAVILKKDGKIGLVLRQGTEDYAAAAKKHGFTVEHQRAIMQGKETWHVLVFARP